MKKIRKCAIMMAVMLGVLQLNMVAWAAEDEIPVVEQQDVELADGNYTISVDLEGGSGRASITTPAEMNVVSKKATATIIWSSSNYDYMIVDGEKYEMTNTEGNSTFEIPVAAFDTALDEPMTVIADTTAMSTPHEVTYTLTFHSETAVAEKTSSSGFDPMFMLLIGIVVLTAAVFSLSATKKK
mgnify:CR=1 FL=1